MCVTHDLFRSSLIFQNAAAQGCPVGVPGLQYVDNWRSWKAEEGDVQVQVEGEEERGKAWSGGKKLPRRRQAGLPQRHQDQVLKHPGCVSWDGQKNYRFKRLSQGLQQREAGKNENTFWFQVSPWIVAPVRIQGLICLFLITPVILVINYLNYFT